VRSCGVANSQSPKTSAKQSASRPAARARADSATRTRARATAGRAGVPKPRAPAVPPDPAGQVLRRFRAVFNAVRNHFRSVEQVAGISGAQVWALSEIAAHPGIGVGALARSMDIHQSTASNLVRALLEARMVASERGAEDQRAVHLHATARGLKVLGKAPTPFVGLLPDALRRLDDATLKRLDRDLDRLIRELRTDPRGALTLIGADD
jgi:DNA-binding MarR family transcriptional regulator